MPTVQQSVDVSVDVTTVYQQWTRFESFSQWMEGVATIEQIDDSHLHWVAQVRNEFATAPGETREWDARIIEQIPDRRIAWESVGGASDDIPSAGAASFEPLDDRRAASPSAWTGSRRMASRRRVRCSTPCARW